MADFKGDLNTLETRQRLSAILPILEPIGPRPATRGRGEYVPPAATGGGGGLTSPINETARTYHDPRLIRSSDGLVAWTVARTETITSQDALGAVEVRGFADVS